MKKDNGRTLLAVALIITAAILVSFFSSPLSGTNKPPVITLPNQGQSSVGIDIENYESNLDMLDKIIVSRDNVKLLVSAMARPEKYRLLASTTLYYSGGQLTTSAEQFVSGTRSKGIVYNSQGGIKQQTILTPEMVYIWSSTASSLYTALPGEVTRDDLVFIPTYEEIVSLEDDSIISAQYVTYNDVYCIFVEAVSEISGYRNLYYISAEQGMLIGAQRFDGETLIYSLTVELSDFEEDEGTVFMLPGGAVVGQ